MKSGSDLLFMDQEVAGSTPTEPTIISPFDQRPTVLDILLKFINGE
jgi:hypothetical protein